MVKEYEKSVSTNKHIIYTNTCTKNQYKHVVNDHNEYWNLQKQKSTVITSLIYFLTRETTHPYVSAVQDIAMTWLLRNK